MIEIHVNKKLEECNLILKTIQESGDVELFHFYSAFLSSWRVVFEVLLYDAAIFFELGFSRDEMMYDWQFHWAAKRLEKVKALEFLA